MPIRGLSEIRRMPRLGKIHLGIKKANAEGVEYPAAVDYFVAPPEVQAIFGEKPKELRIMIPTDNDEQWASQYYRCYSKTRGLICKGNGETAVRMVDATTGALANRDSKEVINQEVPCPGRDCPDYNVQCREVMNLQVLLPEVPGLGVWQIDTGSINSIRNINSAADLIKKLFGSIAMRPLILTIEPQEVKIPNGTRKTVNVLNLRMRGTLQELLQILAPPVGSVELPVSDDEIPEMLIPQNRDPNNKKVATKPFLLDAGRPFPMATVGDLMTICHNKWHMNRTDVLKELNLNDTKSLNGPKALINAYMQIKAVRE